MLTTFESASNRVKGVAFHPSRPWVLCSTHTGTICLWSYLTRTLIERFEDHVGPVRGVAFHSSQPLFVSGGDDYKIKVWNYKQRKCLFTLLGHIDYIRTVSFHRSQPWILSASDDQAVRIWNWQSRQCISVLNGHNHYVMCANFHPKEDLIVSASLDQTVRVWDISALRRKNVSPSNNDDSLRLPQNDLFGNTDAVVRYVLEGHDRGVNWADFHPNLPLIVSGADDRQVKLWRMNETKAWEVDTLRGHFNNVSCVVFHPRQELILSNSEDKTIRIWDMSKRLGVQTFRREHDRFWILCAHPERNLFAAGHDSGMIVFKLERERPAYEETNGTVLYVRDRYLRSCELASQRDVPVMAIRRVANARPARTLSYNARESAVLLCFPNDGGQYELFRIPQTIDESSEAVDTRRGYGLAAVFVARNRFAVLDKTGSILVKNLQNEVTKRCNVPRPGTDGMFQASTGRVLLRSDDHVTLFDVQQRKVLGEIQTPKIKYVVWQSQRKDAAVALLAKDTVIIANSKLEAMCSVSETIRVKSGAWDENGVFIYNTLTHIKYCLQNGDHGTVRTLDSPIYITQIKGNKVHCLDRDGKNRVIAVDNTEYRFKLALVERKYSQVLKMVRDANLIGQSIISYLQKKGYPELALHFVKDDKTRFNLALECGDIEIALESAKKLNDKECWTALAREALRQGNHQVVEMAYQRTKNFERLSFLYLITGNLDKLRKMLKIAEVRQDTMGRFHNALYLGDIGERVRILEEVGQLPLAYLTAATHGLKEKQEALAAKIEEKGMVLPDFNSDASLLQPAYPVQQLHEVNWPLLAVSKGIDIQRILREGGLNEIDDEMLSAGAGAWGADDDLVIGDEGDLDLGGDGDELGAGLGGDGWGAGGDDLAGLDAGEGWEATEELEGLEDVSVAPARSTSERYFVPPAPGPTQASVWSRNSRLAVDHIAGGSFEAGMQLLNQQVGVVNFAPLKNFFVRSLAASHLVVAGLALTPPLMTGLQRNWEEANDKNGLPRTPVNLNQLIGLLKSAYKLTTAGKFGDAVTRFLYIMHASMFIITSTRQEANEAKELIGICREYILALRMETYRKELVADKKQPKRQVELAVYFTHCNLQPVHLMLGLRSAMNISYRCKNFKNASSFARRLIELNPAPQISTQARKVVKFAETHDTNAVQLEYDERNPFTICGKSYTPIYKGSPKSDCPFCGASYMPEHNGQVCNVCDVAQIGREVQGMQTSNDERRR